MFPSFLLAACLGGGICSPYVVKPQAVVAAPYVVPQIFYSVGQSVRMEALVQRQIEQDPVWQEFQAFKAWKQSQSAQAVTAPTEAAGGPVSVHCGKCHGPPAPKGDFVLDGTSGITAETITRALRKIASGEMPKDHELSREEKNQLLQDLLQLELGSEEVPPPEPNRLGITPQE